jgi:hypothetical protein
VAIFWSSLISLMPLLGAKEVQSRIFGAVEALDNADGALDL